MGARIFRSSIGKVGDASVASHGGDEGEARLRVYRFLDDTAEEFPSMARELDKMIDRLAAAEDEYVEYFTIDPDVYVARYWHE